MKWTLERDENAHLFTISNVNKCMRYFASMAYAMGARHLVLSMLKNSFAAMDVVGQGERFAPLLASFVAQHNGLLDRNAPTTHD
jgi:3-hydroxyisobutyrate dehydrogenase-like beta-hydroxyacid dehydrogenase